MPRPAQIDESFRKTDATLRFLMDAFSEVLHDVGMGEVAAYLPWNGTDPVGRVEFPDHLAETCLQAHSIAFQLLNQAEENAVAQHRRSIEGTKDTIRDPGSWDQVFARAAAAGQRQESVAESLSALNVEPVLTAHPTEAKRQTVLEHHRVLYRLLVELENTMWTEAERAELRERVKACLERLWRTGEIYLEKPSLADERRMVLHYLEHVFPAVVLWHAHRLRAAWQRAGWDPALIASPDRLPKLHFGSWVGGDRDGHPGVTASVTVETLELHRTAAIDLIDSHLAELAERVSLSVRRQPSTEALLDRLESLSDLLGDQGKNAMGRNTGEPWRQYVNLMRAALPRMSRSSTWAFKDSKALTAELQVLRTSLLEIGAGRIARVDVDPVIALVNAFGFQLANLDVRQNSAFHDQALSQLLASAGIQDAERYPTWDGSHRRALLDRELASRRPFVARDEVEGDEARAVIDVYRVLGAHRDRYGNEGIGALIVSMTRSAEDLLAVYVLAREGGLLESTDGGPGCAIEVVPLFETIDDLERAPEIMDDYLAHPVVRRSLKMRTPDGASPVQQVMIGYSDSCKDGGTVASVWGLNRVQSRLTEVGSRHGVHMRFFHGRGGTIGRGAGPTHRFVRALPPGSLAGGLRLTEQGETISQKYANRITAAHHVELLCAGTLSANVADASGREDPPELVAIMDELAETSRSAYRDLLEADGFVEFFSQATPIDAIESSRIGSRPARRTGKRSIGDLRAIPWVFAWNQSRFVIPGWYGLGSALQSLQALAPDRFQAVVEAKAETAARWAPLHYLISNAATALMTSSEEIMRAYAALDGDAERRERLLTRILAERDATYRMLERVYGGPLEQKRPKIHRLIERRHQAMVPLHAHQIRLLGRWRDEKSASTDGLDHEEMLLQLLLSVNAIASGLGATG